jgi:hypothetical protein
MNFTNCSEVYNRLRKVLIRDHDDDDDDYYDDDSDSDSDDHN